MSATGYRTLHNRIFFNLNPTYALTVQIDRDSEALEYFLPSAPLPEVNARTAVVTSGDAVAKISAWAREHEKSRPTVQSPFSGPETVQPELGYYKRKGQPAARLVWRGQRVRNLGGRTIRVGAPEIFVDALTGDLIAPDDRQ